MVPILSNYKQQVCSLVFVYIGTMLEDISWEKTCNILTKLLILLFWDINIKVGADEIRKKSFSEQSLGDSWDFLLLKYTSFRRIDLSQNIE
jgi:hypothetical protein